MWGANTTAHHERGAIVFQSTHPCGVRTKDNFGLSVAAMVSIHAPVWGAKLAVMQACGLVQVSIHAPVWGAKSFDNLVQMHNQVSIHAPVWGAKVLTAFKGVLMLVSIHAPVWGANSFT